MVSTSMNAALTMHHTLATKCFLAVATNDREQEQQTALAPRLSQPTTQTSTPHADNECAEKWSCSIFHLPMINRSSATTQQAASKPRILDPKPVVSRNSTPFETLLKASQEGDLLVLNQLIREGVKIDCKDTNFNTPLCLAAQYGQKSCVAVLSKHSRTLNQRGFRKRTPIHLAAMAGHTEIVHLLAMKGARLNVTDSTGARLFDILDSETLIELRANIQQGLTHLDGNAEHKDLCKRFRSSLRAIDKFFLESLPA